MSDISAINPYIRLAMHSVLPRHHVIKRRIIFDYELIYIADGAVIGDLDLPPYSAEAEKSREAQVNSWLASMEW